jgi:hypothetical protein
MALVNPNIAMGYRGIELANPLAQYGQVAAIQGAQQQNQLAQLQMQNARREQESVNALNRAYADAYNPQTGEIDANKLRGSLSSGGFGSKLPAIEKSLSELAQQKLTQEKLKGEVAAQPTALATAQVKLLDDKLKQSRGFLDTLDPASPGAAEAYVQWHRANHADPVIGKALEARGITVDQSMARIQQLMKTPGGLARLINESKLGTEKFMEMNKPTLTAQNLGGTVQVLQTPGLGGTATVVPGSTGTVTQTPAQTAQDLRDRQRLGLESQRVNLEGQRVNIARQEAERKTQGLEALPPKEIQKREAAFPQATSAVKSFETKSEQFIRELEKLRDDPGLDQITGPIYGRTPSVSRSGSRAQALYDKIFAKGGFQALQDMREASKTGGALGNVSNEEGRRLEKSTVGGLDRTQNIKDVQQGINDFIEEIRVSQARVRDAYDTTYSYRDGAAAAPQQLTQQDKDALNWANSNPSDPRAAQIKQRLKVK